MKITMVAEQKQLMNISDVFRIGTHINGKVFFMPQEPGQQKPSVLVGLPKAY